MSGSKVTRFSLMAFAVLLFTGCTHDIRPVVKDQGVYVTKIRDQKTQIVASQDFQRLILKDVPLKSSNWKGQKFNVAIGKTLTDGIYSYVGSTFNDTTIGDTRDEGRSGITLTLTGATVDLWIDDDASFTSQLLFAPSYYSSKVDAQAKILLTGSMQLPNGEVRQVSLTGNGLMNLRPAGMNAEVVEEVAGLAAADVAKQVVQLMRGASSSAAQNKM